MIGSRIKEIREEKKLGINELARLSGVNASYLSALERNVKTNPSVNTLEKLAKAMDISIGEFFI